MDLRPDPYRLLFPLGGLLFWAGVLPWFLLGIRTTDAYRSIYHSMVQVQGALMCFATGFLFTFLPRRTRTPAPSAVTIGIAALAPVGTVVFAWREQWAIAQLFWLALIGAVVVFGVRRLRGEPASRLPESFAWVPVSFFAAIIGALLTGAAAFGERGMRLHEIGRAVVLQGLFSGLILGLAGFLVPVITQGNPPGAGASGVRALHAAAAILFFASFLLEGGAIDRVGQALRAAISLAVLVKIPALRRRPAQPGLHRWFVWLGVWCIPLSNALVALFPGYRRAALHVMFLGAFGLLALAVGLHVTLSHASPQPRWRRWEVAGMGALIAVALVARLLVDLDQVHYYRWLAVASGAFLIAVVLWALSLARPGRAEAAPVAPGT